MTTESRRQQNHNQYHIHTHIHIQLHIHNHIFTMSLCDFITLLQSSFSINQSTKTTLSKRWPHIQKNDTNKHQDANAQSIAHRFQTHRNSYIYIRAKFFSHIMRVYGGGFRLAIMRVYICGKIFALHNTHIKYGENPKIIMQETISNP